MCSDDPTLGLISIFIVNTCITDIQAKATSLQMNLRQPQRKFPRKRFLDQSTSINGITVVPDSFCCNRCHLNLVHRIRGKIQEHEFAAVSRYMKG